MKTLLRMTFVLALVLAVGASLAQAKPGKTWLGVYTQSVSEDMAEAFDLAVDYGAIVNGVIDDSPADDAGLRQDDIIIALDGKRVADDDALVDMIAEADPGDDATLTIIRNGKEREVEVELGRRSSRTTRSWSSPPRAYSYYYDDDDNVWIDGDWGKRGYLGVGLVDLSPEAARALGGDRGGVLVNEVEEDSPAEEAGIHPGDLIIAFGDEQIEESGDLTEVLSDMSEGDVAKVTVVRAGKQQGFDVTVDERSSRWYRGGKAPALLSQLGQLPRINIDLDDIDRITDDDWQDELRDAMKELREDFKELNEELHELQREFGRQ